MSEIDRIQTLQYMGSKTRMLSNICDPIIANKDLLTVVDLFAGTGAVGFGLSNNKHIISNDLEYYAYVINEAILNGCLMSEEELSAFMQGLRAKYDKVSSYMEISINEEEKFLEFDLDEYEAYAQFSDDTPSIFNNKTDTAMLKPLETLVSMVVPGKSIQEVPFPCLFLTYYANAYFGIRQCCQIDSLAAQIFELEDCRQKNVMLAALMSALSATASTTTHFAQYLKVKSKGTFKNIKEKRSQDIFLLFREALNRFENRGLLCKKESIHECYNLDFADCLAKVNINKDTVVYADPPYFKEHYSRYYHVLNTLCLYDYPQPALNPQTKQYSVGRYRTDRNVSDFGKRARVIGAFERMINQCADKQASLIISYSENSLVKIFELQQLAEKRYHVRVEKVELKHSSQGRITESDQNVKEYIFFCDQPDSKDIDIERRAKKVREIKPIVDNPGGFIHNYMARKPYNVVSGIITEFTEENDLIFDPMFGSGTTIIEASKLKRRAIGCDINPIAYKLCNISLEKWDLKEIYKLIDDFVNKVGDECKRIYEYVEDGETRILERCHFDIVEDELVPKQYWYKTEKKGKMTGRKKTDSSADFIDAYKKYRKENNKFLKNVELIPNSRIAIKEGTTVFDYFCNRNLCALDRILSLLDSFKGCYGYEVLEVIVSSAINLIKLSDKKASSQMPYWLPQKNVTSRNAIFIIQLKAKAAKEGLLYLDNECKYRIGDGINIYNIPAQSITDEDLKDNSVNLVLTDPPYTDQVPYLEYSQLWFNLFNIDKQIDFDRELVVSDAPSRNKDFTDFNNIFRSIVRRSCRALKNNGLLIMFYHSFDLKSWTNILNMMKEEGLRYSYQIPTAAPRKSFKTVMSPRSTLDGNYLVFFVKDLDCSEDTSAWTLDEAVDAACECAKRIIRSQEYVTTQDLYDKGMLKEAFEKGYLDVLAQDFKTFSDVIKSKIKYADGYWEVNE